MVSTVVNKVVDPFVDCGRLLLIDRDPITEFGNEDELITRARNNVQFLFNKVWELDKKRVEDSIVAILPKPVFKLPREKPIPEKRAPTKWEEYAKLKGIAPRKHRGNKVFDEASGEWKPRWGYRRGNDNTKDWCIEVPENRGDDVDMFEERRAAKKERVAKNETQRLKNMARNVQVSILGK
ncbi:hypothetical protein PMAYCL1PPCAC_02980 [Pristionchus mayeri]|uniref:Ribosome biogenesis regulatory protein n=1 Tax=Pristionchus mayeri TaxID=1317129 RepID=A0AAN4Z7S7_9BILA|nr:hypothetical protein PMAYCL1PPCAC_02980 [Pristionchus mayeri]